MSCGDSKHRSRQPHDMEALRLPCAAPWGAPPSGILFTSEAYRRYSVAFQQVRSCGVKLACRPEHVRLKSLAQKSICCRPPP